MDWAVVITTLIFIIAILFAIGLLVARDRFSKWFNSWFWDWLPNWVPTWFMPQKFFRATLGIGIVLGLATGYVLSHSLLRPVAKINSDLAFLAGYPVIYVIGLAVAFLVMPVINFFYRIYDMMDDYQTRHTKHDANRLLCPMCGTEKAYGKNVCKKCGYQF